MTKKQKIPKVSLRDKKRSFFINITKLFAILILIIGIGFIIINNGSQKNIAQAAVNVPGQSFDMTWATAWNTMGPNEYYGLIDVTGRGTNQLDHWNWDGLPAGTLVFNEETTIKIDTVYALFSRDSTLRLKNIDTGSYIYLVTCHITSGNTATCKDKNGNVMYWQDGVVNMISYATIPAGRYYGEYTTTYARWSLQTGQFYLTPNWFNISDYIGVSISVKSRGFNNIDLSWSPQMVSGRHITTYNLYRGTQLIYSGLNTEFNDTGLAEGTTYNYKVVATDDIGRTAESSVSATTYMSAYGTVKIYYKDTSGNLLNMNSIGYNNALILENIVWKATGNPQPFEATTGWGDNPEGLICLTSTGYCSAFISISPKLIFGVDHSGYGQAKALGYELKNIDLDGVITVPAGSDYVFSFGANSHRSMTLTFGTPNQPPVAVISGSSTTTAGTLNPFNGISSYDTDGWITNYFWNFGDSTASGVTSNKIYSNPGTYTVTLTVVDNKGAIGVATQTVTVSCTANYFLSGGVCVPNTQTYTCPAKPAGADWNTVPSYTQTWNGSAWLPANSVATYNTTASTTSCNYKCSTNYTWNGSACAIDTNSLTIKKAGTGNGGVYVNNQATMEYTPITRSFDYNNQVYIIPLYPSTGSTFDHWDGCDDKVTLYGNPVLANTCLVNMTSNKTVTIYFACTAGYYSSGGSCVEGAGSFFMGVDLKRGEANLTQGISNTSIPNASGGSDFTIKSIAGQGQILVGDKISINSWIKTIMSGDIVGNYTWSCKYSATGTAGPESPSCATIGNPLNPVNYSGAYLNITRSGSYYISLTAESVKVDGTPFVKDNTIIVTVPKILELK